MKPVDVKWSKYIDFNKEKDKEGQKFKVGDHLRISKYKIFLQNVRFQIGQKRVLWLKKNKKSTVPWTCVISDLNGEEIVENIYENNFKKEIKKSWELKK